MLKSQFTTLILSFFFFFCLIFILNVPTWTVQAQSLPPAKLDGFVYRNPQGHVCSDPILIEAFYDPVCPDSRDSWPPLKRALHHYGSGVSLVLHLLPLPYHDNAFVASRALHIANDLNSSSTFPLLEQFFKCQERFYNDQTHNLTKVSIVSEIVKFVAGEIGNSYYCAIESGFTDRKTDLKTRVSFKYSTSKGVSGTPTFLVNGFVLPNPGSGIDYNGWRSIIDPLIHKKGGKNKDGVHLLL